MLNTDKIYFYPYKIFEVERRKYLYTIYASGLFGKRTIASTP